jgi:hypothetical protein
MILRLTKKLLKSTGMGVPVPSNFWPRYRNEDADRSISRNWTKGAGTAESGRTPKGPLGMGETFLGNRQPDTNT